MSKAPPLPWKKSKKKVIDVTGGASSTMSEDDPLSALTRMAYPLAPGTNLSLASTLPVKVYDRKFNSRFFFRIDPTVAHHVAMLKEQETRARAARDAESDPINAHVVTRAKTLNKDIAPNVNKLVKKVREYLLTELGPYAMGAQGGMDQVREILKTALDTDVEQESLRQFDITLRQGIQIKMTRFLADYLGLNEADAELLRTRLLNQPPRSAQAESLMAMVQKAINQEPTTPSGQPNRPSRAERMRIAAAEERAAMRAREEEE